MAYSLEPNEPATIKFTTNIDVNGYIISSYDTSATPAGTKTISVEGLKLDDNGAAIFNSATSIADAFAAIFSLDHNPLSLTATVKWEIEEEE